MRKTFIIVLWALLIVGILATYIIFSAISDGKIGYVPPIEELENPNLKFATQVISDDGKILGTWSLSKENRLYVGYNDLSPNLVHALVATEDVRFSEHSGIDARAFMRAVIKRGVLMQKNAGGGSTITQQLAKQFYSPTADNVMERLLQKPIEWVIAVKLERYYTKEEILTMYLNKFDFLNNAVGIKTAAGTYFSKEPKDLNIEEAATLIGMCKNPSLYNPRRFNERTRGRRNVVLDQMRKAGYLTEAERDSLQALPLVLKYRPVDHNDGLATYFREYLRGVLNAKKPVKKNYRGWQMQKFYEDSLAWETNPLYGWCAKNKKKDGSNYNLYTDGLKIYTTINSRMQQYAEEAVQEHVAEYLQPRFFKEKKGRKTAPYTNQLTPEEVETILNRSIRQSERRRVMKAAGCSDAEIMKAFNTPREMTVFTYQGEKDTIMTPLDSTIKPYLYSLAMENGFSPCDETRNVEGTYFDENGIAWTPRNSSKKHYGEIVTLKWGLANSNNWISAYLMSKLNPYELVRLIHSFGVLNKEIQPTISLCLGPCEISVGEMVSAYTAFVNKGIRTAPLFVTRIEDNDGNVLATFSPQVNEVISESSAYKMLVMLRAVINEGTGGRIRRLYNITADMGGKTGTTNNNSDGWFMGFTPHLVSGCWVGGEERDIHFDRMADGQGASMALPIWGIYMNKVYADKALGYSQKDTFDIPDGFDPCKDKVAELEEENTSRLDDLFFQ